MKKRCKECARPLHDKNCFSIISDRFVLTAESPKLGAFDERMMLQSYLVEIIIEHVLKYCSGLDREQVQEESMAMRWDDTDRLLEWFLENKFDDFNNGLKRRIKKVLR